MKFAIYALMFVFACALMGCNQCGHLTSRIKSVGGCDRNGSCGATLEDGTVVRGVFQPSVGGRPDGLFCREEN